ncbi:hypothetical protein B0H16DRAFT_1338436 [Mycena metata]|uniref:Uncharacterized protein n=1 Tax=Mycena metata TaxID=1033252 RepID=A0AAD7HCP4_9AGAR|nr:hypothetical protein B0H16DRAFT_1338436 [Mycena metata]
MTSVLTSSHVRLGAECPPGPNGFAFTPPDAALFNTSKSVRNPEGIFGRTVAHTYVRCASSCAYLPFVTMAKEEGAKIVFVGGKNDVKQEHCGNVGVILQFFSDYSNLDTDTKTTHLKTNSVAPPDLSVNGVQVSPGTRALGVWDTQQPGEFQDHPVDLNLALTPDLQGTACQALNVGIGYLASSSFQQRQEPRGDLGGGREILSPEEGSIFKFLVEYSDYDASTSPSLLLHYFRPLSRLLFWK